MGKMISVRLTDSMYERLVKYSDGSRGVSRSVILAIGTLVGHDVEKNHSVERSASRLVVDTTPVTVAVKTLKTEKPAEKGRFNIWGAIEEVRGK